jgi:hypothetical protein
MISKKIHGEFYRGTTEDPQGFMDCPLKLQHNKKGSDFSEPRVLNQLNTKLIHHF